MRYLGSCKMKYQDIKFKIRKTQVMKTKEQDNREIGKKLNTMNPEDLPEYI